MEYLHLRGIPRKWLSTSTFICKFAYINSVMHPILKFVRNLFMKISFNINTWIYFYTLCIITETYYEYLKRCTFRTPSKNVKLVMLFISPFFKTVFVTSGINIILNFFLDNFSEFAVFYCIPYCTLYSSVICNLIFTFCISKTHSWL